jgi:hypothetical protein
MTETTEPTEIKQTIAQKVEALNARKTELVASMSGLEDGPEKIANADEIAVIDRKIRWYAGRSQDAKGSKTDRPTKVAKATTKKKTETQPATSTEAPIEVASTDPNAS